MNAKERAVLLPITIGGILEWYEFYLYVYWAPILSEAAFEAASPIAEIIHATIIVRLLARPVGGVLFGYFGDKIGREKVFLFSIVGIVIPMALMLILSLTLKSWVLLAFVWMTVGKFLQGIPAGGELPGALCYLTESTPPERRQYMCSYLFVGPQIGQILSMAQYFLLEAIFPPDELIQWGWRISFLVAGCLGCLGFFLRKRLHESMDFKELESRDTVEKHPIKSILKNYKGKTLLVFAISIFEVVGFFLLEFFLIQNAATTFGMSARDILVIYAIVLVVITAIMPFIGRFASQFNIRRVYISSAVAVILLSIPFYFAIFYSLKPFVISIFVLLMLAFSIQFALLPSLISSLLPTKIRYSGLGFSFNMADSVVGGLALIFAAHLVKITNNPASFVIILPVSAVIFLFCLKFVSNRVLRAR